GVGCNGLPGRGPVAAADQPDPGRARARPDPAAVAPRPGQARGVRTGAGGREPARDAGADRVQDPRRDPARALVRLTRARVESRTTTSGRNTRLRGSPRSPIRSSSIENAAVASAAVSRRAALRAGGAWLGAGMGREPRTPISWGSEGPARWK